eukprot:sb/3461293/
MIIRFLLFTAALWETAVVLTDWTAVDRIVKIPWDLETTPLQIKTDSALGSSEQIRVNLYDKDSSVIAFAAVIVKFTSPMWYWIGHCSTNWKDLPVQPPVEVDNIWTITKTEIALIITCNGVEVLNYLFADSSLSNCIPIWGGDVVEEIKFSSSDTASDFYKSAPEWKAVERDVFIPWDLERTPLQIKADSSLGSFEQIYVWMYGKDGSGFYIAVRFTSPMQYSIDYCIDGGWTDLPVEPPVEVDKIWTITKTKTALIIMCNGVEVLNYLFADSGESRCVPKWGGDVVEEIVFDSSSDTASDFYNGALELVECPAFTVEDSTQGNWAASPIGTTVSIECAATHILMGSGRMACQEDGSWSSDIPQCDKISNMCPAFHNTLDGSIEENWPAMDPGTTITITCEYKHVLIGDAITCQDNGTWSDLNAKCIRLNPKTKQVWWIAGAAGTKNPAKVLIHELSGPGVLLNSRFHDIHLEHVLHFCELTYERDRVQRVKIGGLQPEFAFHQIVSQKIKIRPYYNLTCYQNMFVKMIRILFFTAVLWETAVVLSEWKAVERNVTIPWNLETTPLQIKTDSTLGSDDRIRVNVYDKDSSVIAFAAVIVKFTSPMWYNIFWCNTANLPIQPPVEVEKIWKIAKTETALIITCNNVEVLNYLFAESSNSNCIPKWGGDVVEQINFDSSYDTASDFYKGAPDWTAVKRNVKIPWDLEGTPLQIKTDSTLGSVEQIYVRMYGKEGSVIGVVAVYFSSIVLYYIGYCTSSWPVLSVQPSTEIEKIWKITKTETAIIISCNGVEVLNYLFANSGESQCVPKWGGDVVEEIEFSSNYDTASDFFKSSPEPVECPAFTVEDTTQGNWAASPTGTTVSIECAATHALVGSGTMTCQEDGTWSNDVPQCDKISNKEHWPAMEPGTTITITCEYKHVLIGDVITCQDNGTWSDLNAKCIRLNWEAVNHQVKIPWNLERTPLQIKTNSTLGSDERVKFNMFTRDKRWSGLVDVRFTSPMQYWIGPCSTSWTDMPVQPPVKVEKIWTITKSETALIITCNDITVVNYLFTDSSRNSNKCVVNMGGDVVEHISFHENDTASDFYNSASEPVECPAFTVDGSTQGSWTASPTGTTATIKCAATHILVGNSTLNCQEDGSWSSDLPQCDKISKFRDM